LEAQPISWHERREKLEQLMEKLGLEHVRKSKDGRVGGERRRVEIGRALSINPAFILLDEPFSGIDRLLYWTAEDIKRFEGQRHWHLDHGSQCARNAVGLPIARTS